MTDSIDTIVCGRDGVQRRVTKRGKWWIIVDLRDREAFSGGFDYKKDALAEARLLGGETR